MDYFVGSYRPWYRDTFLKKNLGAILNLKVQYELKHVFGQISYVWLTPELNVK